MYGDMTPPAELGEHTSLDEDLHTSSQSEDQMEGRFLLDVVVSEGSAVFQLLSGEDESLLIRGDTFLVLDLGPNEREINI